MWPDALLLAAALALSGAAPAADGPSPPPAQLQLTDEEHPPPGSPADQALWRSAHERSSRVQIERDDATRLQLEARNGAWDARLRALAARDRSLAERAEGARRELRRAWDESAALLVRRWPVDPTRGCRYEALHLESVMFAPEGPRKEKQLRGARHELHECVERAELALSAARRSNQALRAALARAAELVAAGEGPARTTGS